MARILFTVLFLSDWVNLSSCRVFDYHFVDQPLTWTEAQTYCRQRYVDLATIQNSEEIAKLLNTLSSFGHASKVWVGLFYKINWAWSDGFSGSGADYRSWKTSNNEPNFASASQFCVCTDSNGTWWDDFCGNHYPFLCYNGTQLDPEYIYVEEEMSWSNARNFCRENFIDMATVRSSTENQRAMTLVPTDDYSWIGLFNDGRFYWSDGSSVLFRNWDKVYNPISSMKVICGVTSIENSGTFYFLSCETKLPFVCYSIYSSHKQVVKMRLETKDSVDLNDPVLKANILKKLQDTLEEHRVTGVTLKWKEHPGGEVFKKERTLKKTGL